MTRALSPRRFPSPLPRENSWREDYRNRYQKVDVGFIKIINDLQKLPGVQLDFGFAQSFDAIWTALEKMPKNTENGMCFALTTVWLESRLSRMDPREYYAWIAPGLSTSQQARQNSDLHLGDHVALVSQLMGLQLFATRHSAEIYRQMNAICCGRTSKIASHALYKKILSAGISQVWRDFFSVTPHSKALWNRLCEIRNYFNDARYFIADKLGLSSENVFPLDDKDYLLEMIVLTRLSQKRRKFFRDGYFTPDFNPSFVQCIRFKLFNQSPSVYADKIHFALASYLRGELTGTPGGFSRIYCNISLEFAQDEHAIGVTVEKSKAPRETIQEAVPIANAIQSGSSDVYNVFDPNLGSFYIRGSDGRIEFINFLSTLLNIDLYREDNLEGVKMTFFADTTSPEFEVERLAPALSRSNIVDML